VTTRRLRFALLLAAFLGWSLALGSTAGSAESRPPEPVPVTPVLSMRRLPEVMLGAVADPKYAESVGSYLDRAAGTSCAVVTQNGRVVYSRSSGDRLAPASTIKLLTATAALEVLGADSRLTTRIVAAGEPTDGIVRGDLTIIGAGDPLLTTPGYRKSLEDPDQVTEDLGAVADAVVDAGIRQVTGSIIGDESALDRTRWIPSWPTRYQIGGVVAPLSALLVNDGQTGFVDHPETANAERKPGEPAVLAAATLRTLLIARGVRVDGGAAAGTAPADAHEVATYDSRPVSEIVGEMITDSDNTTAELLTRLIGRQVSGQGTTAAGVDAIRSTLSGMGLPVDDLVMVDGSGLDTSDRASCPLLIATLARLPADSPIVSSLAVAGRTGTLRKRLIDTAAAGKVRAKTGTLSTVNALAGFAEPRAGSTVIFAMIQNGTDPRGSGVTDGFAERVVTYGDGRRVEGLLPLPAR
jgi:D-alanyl-D-alanine carboxypeptidase/D-alanyl-D-alanine-endopeptidase (penicillin-binding protein 4)